MSKVVELTTVKPPYEGTVGRPRPATCPYSIGLDPLITARFPQRFCFCEYVKITSLPYHTSPARVSDKNPLDLGMLLGQCWIPGYFPTRPIFSPSPRGNGCQLRRGTFIQACSPVPLLTFTILGQGFHFCKSIPDRNEALETMLLIGRRVPACCCNS
jgi:hypothetical protein